MFPEGCARVSDAVVRREPLSGGTYNTVTRVTLQDGSEWVVKVPPPAGTPRLRYEHGLLYGEAVYFGAAAAVSAPVPEVVQAEFGGAEPFLAMSALPGVPWHQAGPLTDQERGSLRRELGRLVGRAHTVAGPGFGYPGEPWGPLVPTWREAFTAMTDAVLDDAERYGARLPLPVDHIRKVLAGSADVLDEVSRPALVHFDLWEGNILVDGAPGARGIGGIIDGERMFWGDPVADFVSLALFGDIEDDKDFLAGYGETGGPLAFDASVRRRLALYRGYLHLIMLVEVVPRVYPPEQVEWAAREVAPRLTEALGALSG
ncbi:phosphotransferase family protein [Streptomyces beijiangensis]|uniref:Aminoglycoside phosphotransferase family protein n=1 Tax=Streptomyces beijiangensis TaxID=163361 RepID=A0A939FA19_9ACTN|nr:aminoglycoside phosphotransferase family protein [Streptomyces beijiangensis]MBO0515391.1 aminoglycoside phosphotransferase family protein [Streptomyces beijiangensis]